MNENEFTYEGKTYKAVATYFEEECRNCHLFYGDIDCIELRQRGMRPPCCPDKRQDGREVIFITTV